VKIAATILPSMVLVKLVELIIYVDWLLHILRNLHSKGSLPSYENSLSTENRKYFKSFFYFQMITFYLENPRAGLIYRRILDIGNFVVNHVSWYT